MHLCYEQPVRSAARVKRNAVAQHLARSVYGEACPMSASSLTYREVSDRGTSMAPSGPVDSLGVLFLNCRPPQHRMQPLPHYEVPQMQRALCQIKTQWAHPGSLDHYHPPNPGMMTMTLEVTRPWA
jgi:hypothetical protein